MAATEDMTAASEKESCHEALFGVDTVGKAAYCLSVTLVDIGEGSATHRAGVDEVEGISTQLCWPPLGNGAHGCGCDDVLRKTKVTRQVECG
jgi:hypothetical protein